MKTNFSDILVEEIAIADPKLAQQYANAQKQLNDKDAQIIALQKQINAIEVTKTQIQKAMVAIEQKSAQTVIQAPAPQPAATTQPAQAATNTTATTQPTTNTTNTAGTPTRESFSSDILRVKKKVNESTFDISSAEPEELEEIKNFMDSESIEYKEEGDTLEFDEDRLDPEWRSMLTDVGIKKLDDFATESKLVLTVPAQEEPEEINDIEMEEPKLTPEEHEEINEEKVFYVQVEDEGDAFVGKIYKLKDNDEWLAKIVVGESETFDKLFYEPSFDEIDIIAFLRDNYADATIISKDEFNQDVLDNETEIQEALKTKGRYIISKLEDYNGDSLIK